MKSKFKYSERKNKTRKNIQLIPNKTRGKKTHQFKRFDKESYDFYNSLYLKSPIKVDFNSRNINNNIINKLFIFVKKLKGYHYNEFNNNQDKINKYKFEINYENKKESEKYKIIKKISEGYARGVAEFISSKYKLPNRVSNAFCKLWELYNIDKHLFPLKPNPKVFNVAEAPGQWIFANNHYYKKNYIDKEKNKKTDKHKQTDNKPEYEINWVANTLNPKHPKNIALFGKDIFSDDYGFMKKYPDRWIYGQDGTGDIMNSANQVWYREYAHNMGKIDLVTNDAGLTTDTNLLYLQKLDFAVLCMILGVSSVGGNCVSKHFLNYLPSYPESYNGTGLFINTMYLYYLFFEEFSMVKPLTSSPNSGEFYVIGKRFKGIDNMHHDKLLKVLDNFEVNNCFFDVEDIPNDFVNKVLIFYNKMYDLLQNQNKVKYKLYECLFNQKDSSSNLCKTITNLNNFHSITNPKFMKWIADNKFSA